jgi:hypothetical protein
VASSPNASRAWCSHRQELGTRESLRPRIDARFDFFLFYTFGTARRGPLSAQREVARTAPMRTGARSQGQSVGSSRPTVAPGSRSKGNRPKGKSATGVRRGVTHICRVVPRGRSRGEVDFPERPRAFPGGGRPWRRCRTRGRRGGGAYVCERRLGERSGGVGVADVIELTTLSPCDRPDGPRAFQIECRFRQFATASGRSRGEVGSDVSVGTRWPAARSRTPPLMRRSEGDIGQPLGFGRRRGGVAAAYRRRLSDCEN